MKDQDRWFIDYRFTEFAKLCLYGDQINQMLATQDGVKILTWVETKLQGFSYKLEKDLPDISRDARFCNDCIEYLTSLSRFEDYSLLCRKPLTLEQWNEKSFDQKVNIIANYAIQKISWIDSVYELESKSINPYKQFLFKEVPPNIFITPIYQKLCEHDLFKNVPLNELKITENDSKYFQDNLLIACNDYLDLYTYNNSLAEDNFFAQLNFVLEKIGQNKFNEYRIATSEEMQYSKPYLAKPVAIKSSQALSLFPSLEQCQASKLNLQARSNSCFKAI